MMRKMDQIFIDNNAKDDPLTYRLMRSFDPESIVFGNEAELKTIFNEFSLSKGKRSIYLTRARGRLLKTCQGMQEPYLCCRLKVLSPISNCPICCSYCFLQFYLNNPVTTVYTNISDFKEEVRDLSISQPRRLFRVTTGELSDSLALDPETGMARQLVELVGKLPNVILELKTKTARVDHLLGLDQVRRVVVSWSLNTARVVEEEERASSSLEARIEAARRACSAGYLVGFHFDPLVCYSSWEQDYEDVIRRLFSKIDVDKVVWVSLGTLRFAPGMEGEMKRFFPGSKLAYGEFIKAADGKMRYIKPIRYELYRRVVSLIRKYGGDEVFVYLCMEMPDAWESVMDFVPESSEHLDYLFAKNIHTRFGSILPDHPIIDHYK